MIFAINTAQKMKFPIKDFFSKCDQIRRKLRIWSHLLNKSLMIIFIFCAVKNDSSNDVIADGFVCYVRTLCNGFEGYNFRSLELVSPKKTVKRNSIRITVPNHIFTLYMRKGRRLGYRKKKYLTYLFSFINWIHWNSQEKILNYAPVHIRL